MVQIPWNLRFVARDIKKNKLRHLITLFAIIISVGVLTAINGAVDTLGYSQIGFTTQNLSAVDLEVTHGSQEVIYNATSLARNISKVNQIAGSSLRYITQVSLILEKPPEFSLSIPMTLIALNFTKEDSLNIGYLEPQIDTLDMNMNETVLVGDFGTQILELLEYLDMGNNITVGLPFGELVNFTVNSKVVENHERFPRTPLLMLTTLETMWQFVGNDTATSIVSTFENHDSFYSAISPEKSIQEAKNIAIDTQNEIGFNYSISIPIATALDNADSTGMRIFLNFIGISTMILTGILIFSLSTISIQEKTKEFAIIRSIGYKESKLYQLPLLQSFLISSVGSILGLLLGNFLSSVLLMALTQGIELTIYIAPTTYLYSLIMGIFLGVGASLIPAKNASRKNLIVSLLGYQSSVEETHISRGRGPSFALIIIGIALSFAGGLIFLAFPLLSVIEDQSIATIFYLSLLITFLLGLVALAVGGIAPVLENILVRLLTLPFKRISLIVRMMIQRNRRRNNLTSLIFAVSLALILYLTISQAIQTHTQITMIEHIFGADLVVQPIPTENNPYMNQTIIDYLNNHSNVESLSYSTPGSFTGIIGTQVRIGDAAFIKSYVPLIYGISQDFPSSLFEGAQFMNSDAFHSIIQNNSVIVSESIARALDLKIGDHLRAAIEPAGYLSGLLYTITKENYGKHMNLTVIGIVSRMPGFIAVHEQETYAPSSAIFVGNTTWNRMAHKGTVSENESQLIMTDHYNQIFLNAKNDSSAALQDIQSDLFLDHGSLAYAIRASEWVELLERQLTQTNSFLTVILSFTTIIAFFAVFASTQTSVLESQTELGVIKAIGLPDNALARIFALENLVITIVSTILGALVGYVLAYLQNFQTYIFLEMPLPVIMPSNIIFIVLGVCYVLAVLGAYIPTRLLSRAAPSKLLRGK